MNVLVSVNCITYNHEKYIEDAIKGFLMQKTDFEYEILIGDDCSTDNTRKIIQKYCNQYPDKIKLITSENNIGARNNIVRLHNASRGKYIATCEGDDYWTDPYKLQKQIEYMEKNPECSMCFHPEEMIHETKNTKKIIGRRSKKNEKFTIKDVGMIGFIPTASKVYRKYTMDNPPKLFFEAVAGDFISSIIVSSYGYVYYIDEVMAVYRTGIESSAIGQIKKRNSTEELIEIQEKRIKTIEDFNEYSNYKYEEELRIAILESEVNILFTKGLYRKSLNKKYRPYMNIYFRQLNIIGKFIFIAKCISPSTAKKVKYLLKK